MNKKKDISKKIKCGIIENICISEKKGTCKKPVEKAILIENYGIKGDAHADSNSHRQISLLEIKSIDKIKKAGLNVGPGAFGENIIVSGLDFSDIKIGDRFKIGEEIILEVTQIGKECHSRCAIFYKTGDCIMPREGIFTKVIKGGIISKGDKICYYTS